MNDINKIVKLYRHILVFLSEHKEPDEKIGLTRNDMFDICELMEKEFPKPLRITPASKRCAICNRQLGTKNSTKEMYVYCPRCGQKIDWHYGEKPKRRRRKNENI